MISIEYNRKRHIVTIEGHAYSGEAGHDLVCSAASILAYTLASHVETMHGNGHLREKVVELEEGKATIKCKSKSEFRGAVTLIFDTICAGFDLLSTNYPDNVSYKISI